MRDFKKNLPLLLKPIVFLALLIMVLNLISFMTSPVDVASRYMMHEFYNQDEVDIAFVGTSRIYRAVVPQIIDEELGMNSFDITSSSQGIRDSYYLLEEMYEHYSPELVFLDVTINRFYDNDTLKQSLIIYDYMEPSLNKLSYLNAVFESEYYLKAIFPALRETNKRMLFSGELVDNVKRKLVPEWRNYDYTSPVNKTSYKGKGFMGNNMVLKEGNWGRSKSEYEWDISKVSDKQVEYYKKAIKLCKDNGSKIVLFNLPQPIAALSKTKDYTAYLEFIDCLSRENDVEFYNFELVKEDIFQQKEIYFRDESHMNMKGANVFTPILAQFISEYLDGTLNTEDYFYSSLEDRLEDTNYVFYTWLSEDEKAKDLKAKAGAGTGVTVEYEFLYRPLDDNEGEFSVYRGYSENPYAELSLLKSGGYQIRVNARAKGSTADYEQYYIYAVNDGGYGGQYAD